ncbi:hypothetical protein D3C79_871540 [compost metagenome]
MLAAAFQGACFVHRGGHVGGQAVDGLAGTGDQLQALAARLVGATSRLSCLGGIVGDIQCGSAHFVGGGGHLLDFPVLLLHAVAGLAGDGSGLVGGAAGFLQ